MKFRVNYFFIFLCKYPFVDNSFLKGGSKENERNISVINGTCVPSKLG